MALSPVEGRLSRMRSPGWNLDEGEVLAPGRTVLRLLGGGTRYEAYLVRDDHLRALAVAKVLRPSLVADDDARAGIAREGELLARLAHPAIPRLFAAALDGERPHLVLEHVEGPRLSTLTRRYGVDVEQLLPLAISLCAALHYLGREGVVHLDVKPRNVVMGTEPKLIDLSIARTVPQLAELRRPVGTEDFMAPEQRFPERFGELGPAADVWGLGATLWAALTGGPPLADALPPRVPELVAGAIRACLDDRPADRPSPAEVGDLLEPLLDGLPSPRIGRFRPGRRGSRAA